MHKLNNSFQVSYSTLDHLIWKLIKWYLGVVGLYFSKRLKSKPNPHALDLLIVNAIMRWRISKPKEGSFSNEEATAYKNSVQPIAYWHGTGRFQYKDGQVYDVLTAILTTQNLRPVKDIFDPKIGEMTSISLARQRMYARVYADMHESGGVRRSQRYGSPRFWAYYFIMASIFQLIKEFKVWNPADFRSRRETYRLNAAQLWSIKVISKPQSPFNAGYFFNRGSDIPSNFAILMGINNGSYQHLETSNGIGLYENRIGSNISLKNVTHLEVPEKYKQEVENLLLAHKITSIEVFALEKCEDYDSRQRFTDLVAVK